MKKHHIQSTTLYVLCRTQLTVVCSAQMEHPRPRWHREGGPFGTESLQMNDNVLDPRLRFLRREKGGNSDITQPSPASSVENLTLLTPGLWTSGLQDCARIHVVV